MRKFIEDDEQKALFQWLGMKARPDYPTNLAFAIPMGGKRDVREAARMKSQGSKAGVPDLMLPVARGGYHGMFIEMKRPIVKGTAKPVISPEQRYWLDCLSEQGYKAIVCYGALEAITAITEYLE